MTALVCLKREPQLLEIILALQAPRSLASRLNGRKQECNQNANNRDNHEKFDKGETALLFFLHHPHIYHSFPRNPN